MRIRIQLFTLMRLRFRIQVLFKMMGIHDDWSLDPPGLHFEPSGLHCERPRLYFEPLILTLMLIRIQLFTLMRIRIQLRKNAGSMLIRIRNPDKKAQYRTIKKTLSMHL
jgi:hypothetical protein